MGDRELMQQALDALTQANQCIFTSAKLPFPPALNATSKAIEALRDRLAQPKEPDWSAAGFGKPSQREWIGLTDEEMQLIAFSRAIEAKLKEKNGF